MYRYLYRKNVTNVILKILFFNRIIQIYSNSPLTLAPNPWLLVLPVKCLEMCCNFTKWPKMLRTHSEYTLLSQEGHLWKCPETGCNRWNMVNIIHIYAKQCEIMQKIWWKSSNGQNQCFTRGNQLRGAKNLEN